MSIFHQSYEVLDNIRLNFSEQGLFVMNITIAFIMFGVALDMRFDGFANLFRKPKPLIIGIISQIILLPLVTFILILIFKPSVSVALGMILVASCPGGNISNFISSLSNANTELSVSLTAVTTLTAIIITPLNFAFWGGMYARTSPLLRPVSIDPIQMFQTVVLLLGVPLVLGLLFSVRYKTLAKKVLKPIRYASIFLFVGFIIGALSANFDNFLQFVELIFFIVLVHNALAFASGFGISKIFKLTARECRSISVETGIQNSGLGLALIFNPKIFPPELEMGGMAFIAAWWGIWHIIAGLILSSVWQFRDKKFKKQLNEKR
jgi:BASS family bile acid:Na+ symporter